MPRPSAWAVSCSTGSGSSTIPRSTSTTTSRTATGGCWRRCSSSVAAVVFAVLAVAAYLVNNWGFVLTQTRIDGSWHLRRGLFTTRETSLDDERVGGVSIGEPLGLRLAGGARLSAIVTGLGGDAVRQLGPGPSGAPGGGLGSGRRGPGDDGTGDRGPYRTRPTCADQALHPRPGADDGGGARPGGDGSDRRPLGRTHRLLGPSPGGRGRPRRRPGALARARSDRAALRGPLRQPVPAPGGARDDGPSSAGTSGRPGSSVGPGSPRWWPPRRGAVSPARLSTFPRTRRSASQPPAYPGWSSSSSTTSSSR